MRKGTLIILLLFFSVNVFAQWKSFYPEKNKKQKENKNKKTQDTKGQFDNYFFLGLQAKALENYVEALEFFNKCININNNEPDPFYQSAIINQQLGNYSLSIEQIKKANNLKQDNRWYIITYAELLFSTQDYKNAAIQYKRIIDIEPSNEQLYFMLSDTYIYNNEFKKAIKVYDDLEKIKGLDKFISLQKHKLYMQLNDKKASIIELESFLEKQPNNVELLHVLAETCLLNDEKEKAFEAFKKISKIEPENGRVHLTLANYYREENQNNKSYEELKLAFKSLDLDIDTKIRIVASYFQLFELDTVMLEQALELTEIIVFLYPEEAKAYALYADILYANNNIEEAKKNYLLVIEKDKTKIEVWRQVLFIQAEENDFLSMQETSEEALLYFPADPFLYYFNGISKKRFKKYQEAIISLETGIEFIIDNKLLLIEFYSSLGDCYHAINNHHFSDSIYEKVIQLDPDNAIVLNNYSYYLSLRKKDLEKAKQMSKKSNEIDPNNGTYQDTYAWILYQKKEYKEAKDWIIKALNNGSEKSPVVNEHYGDILYRLGNKEEAYIQWQKAKKLGEASDLLDKKIKDKKLYE